MMNRIKPIAFYLPQYHPIPENDAWWGKGFTEWTNVKKARPLFHGHYQPHVPHEVLGYYDLTKHEVLVNQAKIAKEYGIYGFCFYHYWFGGKKLLEKPLDNYISNGEPDFPFCICWANENWTRRWDGLDHEILIAQNHSEQDDIEFIIDKIPYFNDKRYIRIGGRPLLLVYKTELLPDPLRTAKTWRRILNEMGVGEIFLARVENTLANIDPISIGFDAAVEFAPDWRLPGFNHFPDTFEKTESLNVYDYLDSVLKALSKDMPKYKYFRGAFPYWDNTARKGSSAFCFLNNDPAFFEFYLQKIVNYTRINNEPEEQFIFLNAWNEWGEGCHLEPDEKHKFRYLEICRNVLSGYECNAVLDRMLHLYKKQLDTNKQVDFLINRVNLVTDYKPFKFIKAILGPFAFIWRKIRRMHELINGSKK
jgi:hypothetical protein